VSNPMRLDVPPASTPALPKGLIETLPL